MFLKKIYRYVFDTYFKWSDVTFIGFLNRKIELYLGRDSLKFHNINLSDIKLYFYNNRVENGIIEKTILIETMHTYAPAMVHVNIMQLLISSTYKTKTIGYSNYKEEEIWKLNRAFGINEFITIYSFFNFKVVLLAMLATFSTLIKSSKFTQFTNVEVLVDGINIGEHIYDQFLRKELHGTYRKKSFKYLMYIYRGCYYYYSAKTKLSKLNVTDIIVNNIVYTNGILIKACTTINKNINIWCSDNVSFKQFSISKTITSKCNNEIPDRRRFKDIYQDFILNHYSKEDLNHLFEKKINDGLAWAVKSKKKDLSMFDYDKTRKNIFLFPHAFNDAVRHANNNIYADYYIWLVETLNILSNNNNINIFIKPHPAEFKFHYKESSKSVVENVLKTNPKAKIFFVKHDIDRDLLYFFVDCIVTVCGSIGLEAPCFGVPVVTAAKATYYEANTTVNSENYEEYKNNLDNIHLLSKLSDNIIFKAKLVYLFATIFRYVDFNFDLKKELEDDVERFKLVNTYFKNYEPIKDTKLYKLYLEMEHNKFDEFINID